MSEDQDETEGDITASGTSSYDNEFYVAVMADDRERVSFISKKHGCNVVIRAHTILPLHLAASFKKVASLKSLLSSGADPELRDQRGYNALHTLISCWGGTFTNLQKPHSVPRAELCLRILCEHRADANAKVEDRSEQTALHMAVRYTALPAVSLLAAYGADLNAEDTNGMTPLHVASVMLKKDFITSLIGLGADVNMALRVSGNTSLHLVTMATAIQGAKNREAHIGCLAKLLDNGAEADAMNKNDRTPLHEACSMGEEELADALLSHGANVNKMTRAKESCLFLFLNHAANLRETSLLAKLLCLTSPLTICNKDGLLPASLTMPCFSQQRERLLDLTHCVSTLKDICKRHIYLSHCGKRQEACKRFLPARLYDFVFHYWENPHCISFVADDKVRPSGGLSIMPTTN